MNIIPRFRSGSERCKGGSKRLQRWIQKMQRWIRKMQKWIQRCKSGPGLHIWANSEVHKHQCNEHHEHHAHHSTLSTMSIMSKYHEHPKVSPSVSKCSSLTLLMGDAGLIKLMVRFIVRWSKYWSNLLIFTHTTIFAVDGSS